MMPICQEPHCRKSADEKVGNVMDEEIGGYLPIYMCEKHAKKFHKKYGGEE